MKQIILILIAVVLVALPAFAQTPDCASPVTLSGQLTGGSIQAQSLIGQRYTQVTITPTGANDPVTIKASNFGYFSFTNVTPCVEYRLTPSLTEKGTATLGIFDVPRWTPLNRVVYVDGGGDINGLDFELNIYTLEDVL
jgi:hypothetical protein